MTESKMQLEDWLDDLCVRFIINLPEEDLSSVARICFQVEEAQWFYEDFIRPLDPSLPSMALRSFCLRIFQHCPLLSHFSADNHMAAFEEFLLYKTRVPVRGAIMLNEAMDSVVLVKGWKKSANWSFPRGKINKDEDDLDCAVREVYEETGYDLKNAGLIAAGEEVKYIEVTMREQHMRLYVFRDVPMETHFEPRTRKEISKIQWYRLSELPAFRKKGQQQTQDGAEAAMNANKFYMVAPFLVPLKKWVGEQKKKDAQKALSNKHLAPIFTDDGLTEEEVVFERRHTNMMPAAHEAKISSMAGLDTMEGATAALHRLLKIQPPTQGLQPEAASAVQSPASKNSGEALLALLQGKSKANSQQNVVSAVSPQTPIDIRYTNAPIPGLSHHQQPGITGPSYQGLENSLPVQPREGSYAFPPRQPHFTQQTVSHMAFQRNQIPDQPFPQPQPHGYPQQQYQPQQLQHPQPLPPQVQRAVFTGDQVHGPLVAPLAYQPQNAQHAGSSSFTVPQPQFPNVHGPIITPTSIQPTPKLTSHSLALLNAFKNHNDQANPITNTQNSHPLSRYTDTISSPPPLMQELSADEGQPGRLNIPDMSGFGMTSSVPAPQLYPSKALPNDDHRTSLLGMFKASNGKASTVDPAATITTPADIQQGSGASSSRQPSVDPSLSLIAEPIKRDINGKSRTQSRTSASPSPFKPVSILTRPSQIPSQGSNLGEALELRAENLSSTYLESKNLPVVGALKLQADKEINTNPAKGFQPRILKRPAPVQPSMPVELAAPSPTFFPGSGTQPSLDRRTSQAPEQKQALLSLFKNNAVAASTPSFDQPKSSQLPERTFDTAQDVMARSRVGSLRSTGGEVMSENSSRRGSHAPISATDKSFLLEYLDAITKGKDS